MATSSSNSSCGSVPLLPSPPASTSTRSTPDGFVYPQIPPNPDPLVVTTDLYGEQILPTVSSTPLPVTDGRVTKLVQDLTNITPKYREYARSQQWFYDAAQGAITRFLINIRATRNVAVDGYRCLAASATNIPTLLRFIELGIEAHIHPLVLQVVGERVQDLLATLL
ncbi:hypothetical protein B0H15DRAFT_804369 [Mycena belliarum]|uniref:Uncharacterized protein n=1 Tax=Mycena belliarum TaxID=1033014 RepID=A0AAD6TTV6_9AGAR|nr:hypothetical protein B0H15DRAFT_804369 [Mycena belliae]